MDFSLTILGTASASATPLRHTSCHLVRVHNHRFLVDCGEGCQTRLLQCGASFSGIDNIFLSHLHGDHIFGIFGLLSTMAMQGRTAPLYIYAPEGFSVILDFFNANFADGVKYEIVFTPLRMRTKEKILDKRQMEVYAFPLQHRVSAFGFLFQEKMPLRNIRKELIGPSGLTLTEIGCLKRGEDVLREGGAVLRAEDFTYLPYIPRKIAYCCDTAPFPALSGYVQGADLIYHDSTYSDEMASQALKYYHSTSRMAARTALDAGAGRLLLGHFSSRYRDLGEMLSQAREVFPETFLAEEFKTYKVPLRRS